MQHDIKFEWDGLEADDIAVALLLTPEHLPTGFLDVHQYWELLNNPNYEVNGGYPAAQLRRVGNAENPPVVDIWHIPLKSLSGPGSTVRGVRRQLIKAGASEKQLGDILISSDSVCFCTDPFLELNLPEANLLDSWQPPSPPPATATVASPRVDAIAAAVFRISRSDAQAAVEQGYIFSDWRPVTRRTQTVQVGDQLVLRGRGRVEILGMDGQTRSGRIKLAYRSHPS